MLVIAPCKDQSRATLFISFLQVEACSPFFPSDQDYVEAESLLNVHQDVYNGSVRQQVLIEVFHSSPGQQPYALTPKFSTLCFNKGVQRYCSVWLCVYNGCPAVPY